MKFTPKAGEYLLDRTSTFEEWYKIWTEWFVLLFALRLFHQRRVPFFWSLGCFAAAIFATPMLWAGADPSGAIPYLVTGGWSRIVRNPGRLLALAITWVSWAVLAWRISRESPKRAPAAALLFFLPLMLGLNAQGALGVGAAVTGLVVGSLFGEFTVAFFLLNALLLVAVLTHSLPLQGVLLVGGAAVGSALRKRSPLPASLLLLGLSASVFLFHGGFLYVSLSVFLLGGGLLAWTLTGIACLSRETRTFLPLLAATFLLSFLLSSLGGGALFWGSVILALLSSELPLQRFRWDGKRFLSAFGHLLTVLIAVNAFFPPFLPNRHFRYARHPRYVIRYQAAVVPKGRPNIDFPEERDER
ncbi:MAG: hypothetical protein D6679_12210 [Candidatus Hydrogenedentota bacterium]|nr:MAG: hypothetical protein D6679_12210 [Candidatus Hydrogenedentota bacterium]